MEKVSTIEKRVYTPKEVSEILGCAINTIYYMIQQGDLKVVKVLSSYRIPKHSLDLFLETTEN